MSLNEVWLPAVGYEGQYEVSNLGRVKSLSRPYSPGETIMTPYVSWGYWQVGCLGLIHRVLAKTFLGLPPGPEYEVNHKDGNMLNNFVDNLEWVTPSQNCRHAIETGLSHHYSKLSEENVREIRSSSEKGSILARKFSVTEMNISLIRRNKIWVNI